MPSFSARCASRAVLASALALGAACARGPDGRDVVGAEASTDALDAPLREDVTPPDAADPEGDVDACVLGQLPLRIEQSSGVPSRLHVPVQYQDMPALLLLDTGSGLTFLREPLGGPDPVRDAGVFQFGCLAVPVIGRAVAPKDPVDGVPVVGTLGTDMLLRGPSELDFTRAQVLLHAAGEPFADAAGWPQTPITVISGAVLVRVELDGTPVRLIVDTGSAHTLWIGQAGRAGDTEVETTDAYGNPLRLYLGTTDLSLGGTHVTVPVLRAPSFPSFRPPASDVVGLLGLSSLGRGVVFDTDARVARVDL